MHIHSRATYFCPNFIFNNVVPEQTVSRETHKEEIISRKVIPGWNSIGDKMSTRVKCMCSTYSSMNDFNVTFKAVGGHCIRKFPFRGVLKCI